MPSSLLSLALGLVCLTGQALSRPSGCPSNPAKVGKAIYFLTNELDCNSVAAIPIGQDGTLSGGTVTPTGGKGSNSVDAEGAPASPDPLVSQGALTVSGNVSNSLVALLLCLMMLPSQEMPTTNMPPQVPLRSKRRLRLHLHVLHLESRPDQTHPHRPARPCTWRVPNHHRRLR